MSLAPGTRLGPYEVLSPLGAGGMGEVYRARDTRLERTVAIKVLSSHLSASPEVRQRFEREARTISQLSHPHICALHDVGREGETEYLVMEYLEGETLADRLLKGPIPLEQTLRYGVQIADALDKAHRQGIVHRDLKPGNVMITKSGVKLLDFGLAKAIAPAVPQSSLTALPTQQGLTQEGTILGTFQYMAPEQLEGKEADGRTDIFAFGCVLYEMATGRKAFSASSQASLVTAIMSSEPPAISSVQPMSPAALDRVVKTCLAKDPEERWQSASDLKRELRWIGEGSQAGMAAPVVVRSRTRERLAWGLTAVAFLATLAAVMAAMRYADRATALSRPMRSSIVLPDKTALRGLAISPDGRRLVVVARDSSGRNLLWIRPLDSLSVQALAGTESPSFPFWSPDSRFIGFFADGKLKKIDASGGPAQTLCDAPVNRGGAWSREGVIVFSPVADGPLYRVSASGGPPAPLTRFDPARSRGSGSEEAFYESDRSKYPTDWSPDGRFILYRGFDAKTNLELWTVPLSGDRKPTPFLKAAFGVDHGQFSPDGRWVRPLTDGRSSCRTAGASCMSWQVSVGGSLLLRIERPDVDTRLFGKLMAVDVKGGSTFEAGAARPLFQTRRREHISSADLFSYDVSADGQRFLVNTDVGEVTSSPLTVVLNWTVELNK